MSDVLGLSSNPAFDPTRLRGDEYAELAQASRNRMLANALVGAFVASIFAPLIGLLIVTPWAALLAFILYRSRQTDLLLVDPTYRAGPAAIARTQNFNAIASAFCWVAALLAFPLLALLTPLAYGAVLAWAVWQGHLPWWVLPASPAVNLLAFFVALFVAVPWLLYQLWAFVAPGLYAREKRLAMPLLVSSVLLFYTGCAFAYFLVLPAVFHFLTTFSPDVIAITPDANAYLDFVLAIFFAFGGSFELPVAMVILVLLGWITPQQFKEGRGYAIVGIFVLAAILTPPDVVSQLMLAIPMCLLYELGIHAARWLVPSSVVKKPAA